jgi:hypothetical protein
MHVVGVYSINSMSLYVDGVLVALKPVPLKFTNTSVSLMSGPAEPGEYFLIDSPAVYRYALSGTSIASHYNHLFLNNDEQISVPDFGKLLIGSNKYHTAETVYYYPEQESWKSLVYDNDNLSYDEKNNSMYLNSGTYGEIVEDVVLNITKDYISSKIDWVASSGVSIYVSDISKTGPWTICTNGSSIPGFSQGSNFSSKKILYFKIAFESLDPAIYMPELYYLNLYFYTQKKLFAHNGGNTIETSQPISGSTWDIDISSNSYPVRYRNYNNGIRPKSSAFFVNLKEDVKSLEMIFTPKSLSSGFLIYNKTESVETTLSWLANGTISKSNISTLYINGQDASSATNISSYLYVDEPNYIFITTTSLISGELWLNGKQLLGARSGVLDDNLYQNIATYSSPLINPEEHYDLYIGKASAVGQDSSITVTEESVSTYSRDRIVFQVL